MNDREANYIEPDGGEQSGSDFRVLLNDDMVEITGSDEKVMATMGAKIYEQLGGKEESPDSAMQQLLAGRELRPRSGIFAISLKPERGVLVVEVRNAQEDAALQADILKAVESVV